MHKRIFKPTQPTKVGKYTSNLITLRRFFKLFTIGYGWGSLQQKVISRTEKVSQNVFSNMKYVLCLYGIQNETRPYISFNGLKIFTARKVFIVVSAVLYNFGTLASHKTCVVGVVRFRAQGIRIGVEVACANENVGHATKVDYFL